MKVNLFKEGFVSIDTVHTMDSEHLHVLDSYRYKNVVRFCTGAVENHRNEQEVAQKACLLSLKENYMDNW